MGFNSIGFFTLLFFPFSNETCYQKTVHQTNRLNNVSFTLEIIVCTYMELRPVAMHLYTLQTTSVHKYYSPIWTSNLIAPQAQMWTQYTKTTHFNRKHVDYDIHV